MKDTTNQIINASIKIFIKKGFIQATTKEIAKEAKVAEVTLYRKFTTKQNLFEYVIQNVLENTFKTKITDLAKNKSTEDFIKEILTDRLNVISQNIMLVRLLISESIMNHLPEELNFTQFIYHHLKETVKNHFAFNNIQSDHEFLLNQLVSILIGYVILPHSKSFNELAEVDKKYLLNQYTKSLLINL